ncbi:hypothetical protein ABZ820_34855 [Streptomyces diacarni]|uniref:hypothetical protein n=1 Tax=Streptomyces diacarni TaxID=2800381 RepID=UPI0033EE4627
MSMIHHRERLVAALAVAERIAETAPDVPVSISTQRGLRSSDYDTVGVVVHCHPADDIHAFAAAFGVPVLETPREFDGDEFVVVEAFGELDGVQWRVWAHANVMAPSEAVAA